MQPCLIALGANLPVGDDDPSEVLRKAFSAIEREGLKITSKSQLYRSPAYPAGSGPDYTNAAIAVAPPEHWSCTEVMARLHKIEADFGRQRSQRWAARSLDLDLIAMGDSVLPDSATQAQWRALPLERQKKEAPDVLILPHPRLQDRAFVLVPLAEIAPDWRHPTLGKTVSELLALCPKADKDALTPL